MPKKTRKEKIIAQYRKKIKLLEEKPQFKPNSQTDQIEEIQKNKPVFQETIKEEKTYQDSPKVENLPGRKFFINDFRKTLIFSFVIFALEIFFYFATIKKLF